MGRTTLARVELSVTRCGTCPRLVACRESASAVKRRSYATEEYWGRGVPGCGDRGARILVVGLAPGAHGANRTGRPFTGDPSGTRLRAALLRAGLATNGPFGEGQDDQQLLGCYLTNVVKCVPPGNRPTSVELRTCSTHLRAEVSALDDLRVVVALGGQAWSGVASVFGLVPPPPFEPDRLHQWTVSGDPAPGDVTLVQSWHTSPLSWNAHGRGSAAKLDEVLATAVTLAGL